MSQFFLFASVGNSNLTPRWHCPTSQSSSRHLVSICHIHPHSAFPIAHHSHAASTAVTGDLSCPRKNSASLIFLGSQENHLCLSFCSTATQPSTTHLKPILSDYFFPIKLQLIKCADDNRDAFLFSLFFEWQPF